MRCVSLALSEARIRVVLVAFVALLVSCVGPTPAKGPDDLQVGGEKGVASSPVAATEAVTEDDAAVPINADDPVRGNRNALVTIVVFSDFQCSFCAKLATIFERVNEAYGEDLR